MELSNVTHPYNDIEEETDENLESPDSPRRLDAPSPTPSEQNPEGDELDRRVYILGTGAVGTFIAHSMRSVVNPPPVTLLLHSRRQTWAFEQQGRALEYHVDGRTERSTDLDYERMIKPLIETVDSGEQEPDPEKGPVLDREPAVTLDRKPIMHLIVAVKTIHTISALQSIVHRLTPESTICFMQNGMGVADEVDRELFPDPATRPHYIQGIISHGLFQDKRFSIHHRGKGTITLSLLPASQTATTTSRAHRPASDELSATPELWPMSARYLMRTLSRTTVLGVLLVHPLDFAFIQIQKLAANCIINPLTTIYNCRNGDLGVNRGIRNIIRLLCAEISLVIRKLPELQVLGVGRLENRFGPKRLEHAVYSIMKTSAQNHSSMWQDVFGTRASGRVTEINYMNGYIVQRGEEMGIKCVCNYMVMQQVHAQMTLQERLRMGLEPFESMQDLHETDKLRLRGITELGDGEEPELPQSY